MADYFMALGVLEMNDRIVECLESPQLAEGNLLGKLYDQVTQKYSVPVPLEMIESFKREFNQFDKSIFNKPKVSTLVTTAVVDTGLMSHHPWINQILHESTDFTGEGTEDRNGHGTYIALLGLSLRVGVYGMVEEQPEPVEILKREVRLLNVKALCADGRGTEENLIKAILWAIEKKARIINISAGIYRKKWGLLECNGDCRVCKAAIGAATAGILVMAAAGNEKGKTYCPAMAGLLQKHRLVFSIANPDSSNSGIGNLAVPSSHILMQLD